MVSFLPSNSSFCIQTSLKHPKSPWLLSQQLHSPRRFASSPDFYRCRQALTCLRTFRLLRLLFCLCRFSIDFALSFRTLPDSSSWLLSGILSRNRVFSCRWSLFLAYVSVFLYLSCCSIYFSAEIMKLNQVE